MRESAEAVLGDVATNLLLTNPDLDLAGVRALLDLITARGFERGQDLTKKLDTLIQGVRSQQL